MPAKRQNNHPAPSSKSRLLFNSFHKREVSPRPIETRITNHSNHVAIDCRPASRSSRAKGRARRIWRTIWCVASRCWSTRWNRNGPSTTSWSTAPSCSKATWNRRRWTRTRSTRWSIRIRRMCRRLTPRGNRAGSCSGSTCGRSATRTASSTWDRRGFAPSWGSTTTMRNRRRTWTAAVSTVTTPTSGRLRLKVMFFDFLVLVMWLN